MMEQKPRISIIMQSYNHAKYIRQSIESVLGQTFTDFEFIIIDDASTDESWSIITEYSDPRIRPFRNETSLRVENARRAISELAVGELIAIQHSDDTWEPDKLDKQVAFLDSHPEIGAVFSWAQIIDENNQPFTDENHFYYKIFEQPNRTRFEWLNFFFYHGNALCHPSVLIRKQCYADCGLYRYGFSQMPDLDMWVRLCLKYEIHVLSEKLVHFRVRAREANTSGNRPDVHIRGQFEYLQILYNYLAVGDGDEFQKIFPEASQYFQSTEYDTNFALAMISISAPYHFARLFGIQLLFDLLNNPSKAGLIQRVYQFSARDFFSLSGEYDIFSVIAVPDLISRNNMLTQESQELKEIKSSRSWKLILFLKSLKRFMIFFRKLD